MTLEQAIGRAIRSHRKAWPGRKGGMTLRQLSERTGIPVPTISNYEQERTVPRLSSAFALAHELGINLNLLVHQVHNTPQTQSCQDAA